MTNQVTENTVDQNANLLAEIMIPASNVLTGDRFNEAQAACGTKCGAGCGGGCGSSV